MYYTNDLNISWMFDKCPNLTSIYMADKDTDKFENMIFRTDLSLERYGRRSKVLLKRILTDIPTLQKFSGSLNPTVLDVINSSNIQVCTIKVNEYLSVLFVTKSRYSSLPNKRPGRNKRPGWKNFKKI